MNVLVDGRHGLFPCQQGSNHVPTKEKVAAVRTQEILQKTGHHVHAVCTVLCSLSTFRILYQHQSEERGKNAFIFLTACHISFPYMVRIPFAKERANACPNSICRKQYDKLVLSVSIINYYRCTFMNEHNKR